MLVKKNMSKVSAPFWCQFCGMQCDWSKETGKEDEEQ